MRTCRRALFFFFCLFPLISTQIHAASLTVSLSVGMTFFSASGLTSPNAYVVLKESGSVIATTTSDNNGAFNLTISSYDGTYTYTLYAVDIDGTTTGSLTYTVALTPGNTTSLGGIVFPPTYHHNGLDKVVGEDLIFEGMGVPNSTLNVFFDNTLQSGANIGSSGRYNFHFSTNNIASGTHTFFFQNALANGTSSLATPLLTLTLHDKPAASSENGEITATIAPSQIPNLPGWLNAFDVSGDGRLSGSEIKEIITRWLTSWLDGLKTHRGGGSCDLNHDGVCNLTDFSILLYYIEK